MKKLHSFMIIAIFLLGLMLFPQPGSARMEALTEDELSEVTGQGGFSGIISDQLGLDLSIDTLYWGDEDGFGGETQGGYLSFCDIMMQGFVEFGSPATMDIETSNNGPGETEIHSLNIALNDMTVHIDEFRVGAIRLGSEPGTGNSFGSIGISGMTVNMTGNIKISMH